MVDLLKSNPPFFYYQFDQNVLFYLANNKRDWNTSYICIDIQGWKPPKSFEGLLKTRANKIQTHSGILEFSLDSEMVMYGRG